MEDYYEKEDAIFRLDNVVWYVRMQQSECQCENRE